MTAVGYIRQSKRADLDAALSYDAQLAAIRRMAGDDIEVLSDMGRSGKAGAEHLRPSYCQLLAGMESGEYTEVYAIALSRFSRSVPELHALMTLARDRGITIVTAKEGTLSSNTPTGRMTFTIWAAFAELVRDMAVESALENAAVRRSRGERMGRLPYGSRPGDAPEAVLAAFEETRSLNGAALALNRAGVPSWSGGRWNGTSVRVILARTAPGSVPLSPARGVKPASSFILARLLRCGHDGNALTASRSRHEVVYRCHRADGDPDHPRPYRVRESVVLPWVMAEADRLTIPASLEVEVAADDARRAELERKRVRIIDAQLDGTISKVDRDRRLAATDAAIEALGVRDALLTVPAVDWSAEPAQVNAYLRAIFREIALDTEMRPVSATWNAPSLRAE